MGDTFNFHAQDSAMVGAQVGKVEGDLQIGADQMGTLKQLYEQVDALRMAFQSAITKGELDAGSPQATLVSGELERVDHLSRSEMPMLERIRVLTELIGVISPVLAAIPGLT